MQSNLAFGPSFHPQTLCIDNVSKFIINKVSNVEILYIYYTKFEQIFKILELSIKEEKHSTRTLSLVIHRVTLKKNLQKSTLASKGG